MNMTFIPFPNIPILTQLNKFYCIPARCMSDCSEKTSLKNFIRQRQQRNNDPLSYILTEIDCQSACAKRVARQNKSKCSQPLSSSVTNANRLLNSVSTATTTLGGVSLCSLVFIR